MSDTIISRRALEATIETLVALLDAVDGDADIEDATDLEDDHALSPHAIGYTAAEPGCAVADGGDISVTEWHTRGRFKESPGITGADGRPVLEDAEDDDPAEEDDPSGQCDEDGVNTAFDTIRFTPGARGAGCPISNSDCEHDGREPDDGY